MSVSGGGRGRKRVLSAAIAAGLLAATAQPAEARKRPVYATEGCVSVASYSSVPLRIDTRRELEAHWRIGRGRPANVAAESLYYDGRGGIGIEYPACTAGDRVFVVYGKRTREWFFMDYAEAEWSL